MILNVDKDTHFSALNSQVRNTSDNNVTINGCMGQRYVATGSSDKLITINGTPGNALGAYLNGSVVVVNGNAQDATGDTMNGGEIIIHGSAGDATGYAMRGGKIYISGNTGYRAGIHMKAYKELRPVIVVGGRAGSFLGEYQAGGIIVVLGQNKDGLPIINNFCGTGMHGGVMYLRCDKLPHAIPGQVRAEDVYGEDCPELVAIIDDYCRYFPEFDRDKLIKANFKKLTPNSDNPYKQLYTDN